MLWGFLGIYWRVLVRVLVVGARGKWRGGEGKGEKEPRIVKKGGGEWEGERGPPSHPLEGAPSPLTQISQSIHQFFLAFLYSNLIKYSSTSPFLGGFPLWLRPYRAILCGSPSSKVIFLSGPRFDYVPGCWVVQCCLRGGEERMREYAKHNHCSVFLGFYAIEPPVFRAICLNIHQVFHCCFWGFFCFVVC